MNKCCYCERRFGKKLKSKTMEHIMPYRLRKQGFGIGQTIPVCKECNYLKGSQTPIVFIGRLQTMIANVSKYAQRVAA